MCKTFRIHHTTDPVTKVKLKGSYPTNLLTKRQADTVMHINSNCGLLKLLYD